MGFFLEVGSRVQQDRDGKGLDRNAIENLFHYRALHSENFISIQTVLVIPDSTPSFVTSGGKR